MSASTVFFYYFIGSSASDPFLSFADKSYESMWYEFTIDLQRYIQLIVANVQRKHFYRGPDANNLNFSTLQKVMQK